MAHAGGELTDFGILFLSGRVTTEDNLMKFGIDGLKLPYHQIRSTLTNHPGNFQSAVQDVLHMWAVSQSNRSEAMTNMMVALEQCRMNQLLGELRQHIQGAALPVGLSADRIGDIQRWTKQSFGNRPFCLVVSNDWTLRPKTVDIRKVYMDLSLSQKIREGHGVDRKPINNLLEMLRKIEMGKDNPQRVLLQAEGGMGKTTALKHLAVSWSDGTMKEMAKFEFVFHVSLKRVKDNSPIENIIIAQHRGLEANRVKPEEMKTILDDHKPLILVDGCDEYKPGTNSDMDKALEKKSLWNCSFIVTSRETEDIAALKDHVDAEFKINGFDANNIHNYITKAMANDHSKADQLLQQAVANELCLSDGQGGYMFDFSFLMIPLLLNMICSLFRSGDRLPKTKTGVIESVVNKIIDRESIRTKGQKAKETANTALQKLGELAWQGLDTKKFIFLRSEVRDVAGQEALDLGLLVETEDLTESEEEVDALCFPQRLFQEFVASKFIILQPKSKLDKLFPSWVQIMTHQEVIKFAIGLSQQPLHLIDIIYERLIEFLRFQAFFESMLNFMKSLGRELRIPFNIFNNKYINYATKSNPVVHIPSRMYKFDDKTPNAEAVNLNIDPLEGYTDAECSIFVSPPFLKDVLGILQKIQRHLQVFVTTFYINHTIPAHSTEEETSLLKRTLKLNRNTLGLNINNYHLCHDAFKHIAQQLRGCTNLEELHFSQISQFLPQKLGEAISSLVSLRLVRIECFKVTSWSCSDIMKGLRRCPNLRNISFVDGALTESLVDMFCGANHPGFKYLTMLNFSNTKLCRNDIAAVADAARHGRLPSLNEMVLSGNILTGCMDILFSSRDGGQQGFQNLNILGLHDTKLGQADIEILSKAKQLNRLPVLKHADISDNHLSGCIARLFSDAIGLGFANLQGLDMSRIGLNQNDLKELGTALQRTEPMSHRSIHLIENKLTGILGHLFDQAGLPHVGLLDLQGTTLNKEDINSLSKAVTEGKLPHLRKLYLIGTNLRGMETEFKNFLKLCTRYFKQSPLVEIKISFENVANVKNFQADMISICKGTSVSITWTEINGMKINIGGSLPLPRDFFSQPLHIKFVPSSPYLFK